MANAYFYNSNNGDRLYDADSFSDWLKKFFTTGVFTGDLQVLESSGMQVAVQTGYANIKGKVKFFDEATYLDVNNANATYDRIDTVVVERNDTDRDFSLKVVAGSATDTPTATAPVREGNIYQLVLAEIYVKAGVTAITQADITDKRLDSSVCGIVASTVKEIDFTQIQAQYDSYMANYKAAVAQDYKDYDSRIVAYEADARSSFLTWFDEMKDQLSKDAAGNLQLQCTELEERLSSLEHMTLQNDYSAPISLEADGDVPVLLTDDLGAALLADWEYKIAN